MPLLMVLGILSLVAASDIKNNVGRSSGRILTSEELTKLAIETGGGKSKQECREIMKKYGLY